MSHRSVLALIALALVLTTACNGNPASPQPSDRASAPTDALPSQVADARPTQIRVALNGPVLNLDPLKAATAADSQIDDLISGKLLRLDREGVPQLDLLESMEVSSDGLTYTMRLLPDLRYSDGTPVVAEDVVYIFELVRDAPLTFKALTDPVSNVQALDDRTVVWTLNTPFPDWILHLVSRYGVVHPHERIQADHEGYFRDPVSAGPYQVVEGEVGAPQITLERNPNYPQPPRAIERLEFVAVPDLTSRTLQLGQGDLDFVHQLSPSVRDVIAPDVSTFNHSEGATLKITFNGCLPDDHPLRNRDVREAISLAIDRQKVAERAFFGVARPATGMSASVFRGFVESLPNGGARDLEKAKEVLASTPFADGFTFDLLAWGERPGYQEAALLIKEDLADLGIEVNVENTQIAVALASMDAHEFEANFGRAGGGEPLVSWMANMYTPSSFWGGKACYDNPVMSGLLRQISSTSDDDERADLWKQIHDLAYSDLPFVPVVESYILSGTRVSRELLDLVPGRDVFYVGAAN